MAQTAMVSRIAPILRTKAEEFGWDYYDVAEHAHCTYEYARRLLSGLSIPTEGKLLDIIIGFQFNEDEAENLTKLADEDRRAHDHRRREVRSTKYPNYKRDEY